MATELFMSVLDGLLSDFATTYSNIFMRPQNVFIRLVLLFFLYILIQVAINYVPLVDKLVGFVVYPFRALHVSIHVRVAMYLSERRAFQWMELEELARAHGINVRAIGWQQRHQYRGMDVRAALFHSQRGERESLLISSGGFTDTLIMALSPAIVALIFFVVSMPFQNVLLSQASDEVSRALLHAYFSLAAFGGLMPSLSDFKLVSHVGVRDRQTPLWVQVGTLILGLEVLAVVFIAFQDVLLAVILGTIAALFFQAFFVIWEFFVTIICILVIRLTNIAINGHVDSLTGSEKDLMVMDVSDSTMSSSSSSRLIRRASSPVFLTRDPQVLEQLAVFEDEDWWDQPS